MSGLGDCFRISNLRRGPPIARDAPLAASSRADGARMRRRRGVQGRVSGAERPASCRFRLGRPATSFDRQRSDAGIAVLHGFRTTVSPVNIDLPSAPPGYSIKLGPASGRCRLASLRVRPARGSRVAAMPVWGRYVALATDHEQQDAAPSRDIHCDLRSRAVRPSRRRNAIP